MSGDCRKQKLKMMIFASSEDSFQTKKYINLSSQGDMSVESMVIRKYLRFSTNTKLNANPEVSL